MASQNSAHLRPKEEGQQKKTVAEELARSAAEDYGPDAVLPDGSHGPEIGGRNYSFGDIGFEWAVEAQKDAPDLTLGGRVRPVSSEPFIVQTALAESVRGRSARGWCCAVHIDERSGMPLAVTVIPAHHLVSGRG